METAATQYLLQNRPLNIDMLAILDDADTLPLYAAHDGVLLKRGDMLFLSATPSRSRSLLSAFEQTPLAPVTTVVLHDDALRAVLQAQYGFRLIMDCRNCFYDGLAPISYALPDGAVIRPLTRAQLPIVLEHYHTVDDPLYIRDRLDAGMFGVFFGDTLAGFIGTHSELSIGMLEILPPYRRLGLAFALEARMINSIRSQGRIAYGQVELHNEASFALQSKLGMTIAADHATWLERD